MKALTPLLMTIATLAFQTIPLRASQPIRPYLESGKSGDFNYAVYNNMWLRHFLKEGDAKNIPRVAITGVDPGTKGEIEIPSSIEGHEVYGIDENAFKASPEIRVISIPKTVRYLQPGTLNRCQALEYIDIADDHPDFTSVDGVMFDKRKAKLLAYPGGRSGECKFPASTTSIGPRAFSLNQNLKSLSIPASVTDIGSRAKIGGLWGMFEGEVFQGCIHLERIDLPETVTIIGRGSFENCDSLQEVNIPPKVTKINECLFKGCTSLTRVTMPDGITSIGMHTFSGCEKLTLPRLPESITSINNYAFAGYKKLTLPRLPESLTTFGTSAFKDCKGLKGLKVPESVTNIEGGAFYGTEVEIPGPDL